LHGVVAQAVIVNFDPEDALPRAVYYLDTVLGVIRDGVVRYL
jgi:hypothetical protein